MGSGQQLWVDEYGTGSGGDRVDRTLKLSWGEHIPRRYRSGFRICLPVANDYLLTGNWSPLGDPGVGLLPHRRVPGSRDIDL